MFNLMNFCTRTINHNITRQSRFRQGKLYKVVFLQDPANMFDNYRSSAGTSNKAQAVVALVDNLPIRSWIVASKSVYSNTYHERLITPSYVVTEQYMTV